MWKLSTLAIVFAVAIPAQAQELIFGVDVGGRWDSNVFSTPNPESDFSTRLGPTVKLLKEQGDLTYDFHFSPIYQAYSRFAGLDDWDLPVSASLAYQLDLQTSLQFRNLFDYAPAVTNFLQQLTTPTGLPLGTQVVNVVGHFNVLINSASIDLQHQWSELWSGQATVTSFYYDPKVQDGIPFNNTTAGGNITYALSPRDRIGGALGFTAQQFGSNSFQNSSTSYFYNVAGVWNHEFSPTWSLRMQAGPTYVTAGAVSTASTISVAEFPVQSVGGIAALIDFKNCPAVQSLGTNRSLLSLCGPATLLSPFAVSPTTTVPLQGLAQGSQTSLTYFANIGMSKSWETVTANLGYTRSAGSSGVFSSSTEIDSVNGSLVWNASPAWTTSLSVIWSDQGSSSNNTNGFLEIVQPFPYGRLIGQTVSTQTPQAAGVIVQTQRSNINVYQWIIGLHSDYKITKRLSVYASYFYLNQSASQQGGQLNLSGLSYDASRIDLGFHYEFDPIHL